MIKLKQSHNKEVGYIHSLIILLIVVLFAIIYLAPQKKVYEIESEVTSTLKDLNHYLQTGINSVHYLSTLASELSAMEEKLDINLTRYVHSVNDKGEFALDDPAMPNITGHGGLQQTEKILSNMEMSLALYEQFKVAKELNQDYAWIYYISKYKFLTMYPYIPSSAYIWHQKNSLKAVWQYALPKNNPKRELFFTPLYIDGAGKGLMLTIGKPVYKHETFQGTLDIDITVDSLSQFLDRHNFHHGKYILVNSQNQIVAASGLDRFKTDKVFYYKDFNLSNNRYNNYTMVKNLKNAPWKLYYIKDNMSIYFNTGLYTLFILFILWLLFKLKALMLDLDQSNKELAHLASIDAMTELYNKRYFDKVSNNILKEAKLEKVAFSLFILDIDKFKSINDTYGHVVGDEVIIHISNLLKKSLRKEDIICRYGGEEFIVLLPHTILEDAVKIAEKIRSKIEVSQVEIEENVLSYRASFGVATFQYKKDTTMLEIINRADKALYRAKNNGRNRVEVS